MGGVIRWYKRYLADGLIHIRRQIRRATYCPSLAWRYRSFRAAIHRQDWCEAHALLPQIVESARQVRDYRLLDEMAKSARRFGEDAYAVEIDVEVASILGQSLPSHWAGEKLDEATIVIHFMESEKQGLAIGMDLAGYVKEVADSSRRTVLVVEKRMVPIFARTLPDVEVHEYPYLNGPNSKEKVYTANPLILKNVLGVSEENIGQRILHLKAHQDTAKALRQRYLADRPMPLIGISWWSSHFGKDLPDIALWEDLIRLTPAIFVNIQYGCRKKDEMALARVAPDRFVNDETVDQMADMDLFASQLKALDAVITISNTGAHLASSMGLPVCLIRDDWFRRGWPVLADRSPWYPNTKVFGKNGGNWESTFEKVISKIRQDFL